jgi:membrane protein DedA with SNARE-associated domain
MLEEIIAYLSTLDSFWIFAILFFFAYIENILPPSPSDLVIVFGTAIISKLGIGFTSLLLVTTLGSGTGFISMYLIGEYFGTSILRKGKIKFLKEEYLKKADLWFHKYGYKIIIINRFLPGTRAVVSFFAGVHRLKMLPTFLYAIISAAIWNSLLIFMGFTLGENIDHAEKYLNDYSLVAGIVFGGVVLFFLVRYFLRRNKKYDFPKN